MYHQALFWAQEQMAHSWDSRRISMHNMSLKSEGLGDEDGVAAWGVGKELRRDFGMLLLDGIVKFVTTVKVSGALVSVDSKLVTFQN